MFNSPINKLNIAQIFGLLFLVSLFFPIRYVFPSQQAFQTGAYSDFTSISLYLSDIFLFLTIFFIFLSPEFNFKSFFSLNKPLPPTSYPLILLIWLILDLIWHINTISPLNIWFFAKYLELIVAYETFIFLWSKTDIKAVFIKVFVVLTSIQSILAILQFAEQRSLGHGLQKLGEQILGARMQGIAKIVSGGTTYIRGYGTFPHPNLLSAFLIAGVLLCLYLWLNSNTIIGKTIIGTVTFLNLLGLTVTFSRAGFLGLAVALIIFFGFLLFLYPNQHKKKIWTVCLITLAEIGLCFVIFQPFLASRATITDDAALQRIFYAKIGLKMIAQHPIFGVGIGDSVLHMQQYSPIKLWPWQIQPIHNYFLLAAAELGIPGALIFVWLFLSLLWSLIKKLKSQKSFALTTSHLSLATILIAFLILMQLDHYFYTLQQTQMLLWVVLGIIAAEIKNPQTGDL